MQIEGQAAIVTGGGSGLGAATAEMLAAAGARVALLDLDADRAPRRRGRLGGLGLACDVADAAERRARGRGGARGARAGAHPGQLRRHRAARRGSSAATGRCRSPTSRGSSRST